MFQYRVSLKFAQLPDAQLSDFFQTTSAGLTGNAAFPNLPVPLATFEQLGNTFIAKLAAAADGGKLATAEKNAARLALLGALRQLASYVQTVAGGNLPTLLSSGFRPVTTNTTQTPLPKPVVENIDNFQSTKLMIRLKSLANARAIEARRKVAGTPEFTPAGIFTRPSRIEQTELQPGTVYEFQFRAHGGSTGASDWSDPVAHMAT